VLYQQLHMVQRTARLAHSGFTDRQLRVSIILSTITLNNFRKHSLRQSKQGLKLEEDFDEEMKDQEAGGDDLQEIFDMIDG